jgi:hypothetical protein
LWPLFFLFFAPSTQAFLETLSFILIPIYLMTRFLDRWDMPGILGDFSIAFTWRKKVRLR